MCAPLGWGKPSTLPPDVDVAVRNGATRAVFVGNITDEMNESFFRTELDRFGPVDQVKILADKKIAFVHFFSINAAIKCVATIPQEDTFKACKINHGRDRCNKPPSQLAQQQQQQQQLQQQQQQFYQQQHHMDGAVHGMGPGAAAFGGLVGGAPAT